jgi:hypothetical protein
MTAPLNPRIDGYGTDENGLVKYYHSAKGSKRHASWYCINGLRRISSGEPIRIAPDKVGDWAPCTKCCHHDEAAQTDPTPAKPEMCRNSGVTNPRRLYSECTDCGKSGSVNRSNATLRAHVPLNAN